MTEPRIVDMRLRPRWLHPFFGAAPGTPEFEVVRWLNHRVGSRDVDHFTRAPDLAGLILEMDEAGVAVGLVVARSTPTVHVGNDQVAGVVAESGGRLLGVASLDPTVMGREEALAELRRSVRELDLRGLNVDAGFYATPLRADAEVLMPLYEECARLGVPAFVMSGPTTPDLALNEPFAVDVVARTFPTLPLVCCHGFYPRVADMVAVAFRHENVLVSPDMYLFSPGGGLYVEAANGFMGEQLLFGSSYPFRPIAQGVADLRSIGLSDAVLEKVGSGNARRLLGLG